MRHCVSAINHATDICIGFLSSIFVASEDCSRFKEVVREPTRGESTHFQSNTGNRMIRVFGASSRRCNGGASMLRCCHALPPSLGSAASVVQRRYFISRFFGSRSAPKVSVDTATFDKTSSHFVGKFLGIPMDSIVFYSKAAGGLFVVYFIVHLFFKGYSYLTEFSLATVARLGFMGGFCTCAVLYTLALQVRRRVQINPNAVYNQSISLAMRNPTVLEFLGPHPRTGDFKAYCATGGFKLPLLRRLRSGSYELGDVLGLKPRRLRMMFILRNPANGREGLVTVDVQKEQSGFMRSTDTFRSLAVSLSDTAMSGEPKAVIIIGRPEDVVYQGFIKL